jgi:hypothetical protein
VNNFPMEKSLSDAGTLVLDMAAIKLAQCVGLNDYYYNIIFYKS